MFIVGEKINSSIKKVGQAIENRDTAFIQDLAQRQAAGGAHWLDVNAGCRPNQEVEDLEWLVRVVQEVVDLPLALDSPRAEALSNALKIHKGHALINSISAEPERLETILPLVQEYGASVIALCCGRGLVPDTAPARLQHAQTIALACERYAIPLDRVYFDPLVLPISLSDQNGRVFFETLQGIKREFPQAKTISGLSNISHGMPERRIINRAFLILALGAGMDAAILDPIDGRIVSLMRAAELLLGSDRSCVGYLRAFRQGKLVD